jgi:hypothetical protein
VSVAALVVAGGLALAAGQYGPGASDAEIKIGNTMPYSGPASPYGTIGKSEAAYFAMINEQGGINGRKINFISRDDSYSPPKTVELVRKLVEQDGVVALFQTFWNGAQLRDPRVPERQQGAATLRPNRRQQVERSQALSLDDGLAAQLSD